MTTKIPSRRKVYMINKRFQYAFIARTIIMAVILISIFFAANVYFFWLFAKNGRDLGLPEGHVYFQFIAEQQQTMGLVFAVVSVLTIIGLFVTGVVMSNKIAGPIYRLTRDMAAIADGRNMEKVRFRTGDYFPELADSFNRQLAYWRSKVDGPSNAGAPTKDSTRAS